MPGTVIAMDPAPIWRPTARLLVVDPLGRVLLFSALDPRGPTWWFTPGGGMRPDETLASAAVRELAEETGYACGESEVGPVVATCAGRWLADDGRRFFGADSFFFVRVTSSAISTDGQEALERSVITGHRWWTPDELRRTSDVIVPFGLADLVASLLSDGRPARPVRLPWRRTSG
jgi:8-oxo-dGTP pyrophosphatase MutT (NUDIX family)